jgi:hypothetical protein
MNLVAKFLARYFFMGIFTPCTTKNNFAANIDLAGLSAGQIVARFRMPVNATIVKHAILADASGSVVLDIWKDTHTNAPPTVADTITAAAKPTLSAAQKTEDATLTGWTKTVNAGDWLVINCDSVTTIAGGTFYLEFAPR